MKTKKIQAINNNDNVSSLKLYLERLNHINYSLDNARMTISNILLAYKYIHVNDNDLLKDELIDYLESNNNMLNDKINEIVKMLNIKFGVKNEKL